MKKPRTLIPIEEAQGPFFAGVDLGGTNIKVGLVDDRGRSVAYLTIRTDPKKGAENATARMAQAVKRAVRGVKLRPADVAWVGLGSPGTMDLPTGMLLEPVNLVGWENFPIRDRLAHHCGKPVAFANDAAAAAYGEYWIGSGRKFHSLVLLTLGTGIGCGIIVGDSSIDGENSHGAECGHIIINSDDDARWCCCGQRGHLEAYASATAVIKRAQEAIDARVPTRIQPRVDGGEELTPKLIAEVAEEGDPFAKEIILDTARYLGIGIVSLIHTIDPNGVLLGGAMTFGGEGSKLGRAFLARIRQEVRKRAFPTLAKRTKIHLASLGSDAGYIGAAGLARVAYRKGE